MDVYLNGKFVPHDRATLSAHDAAVQHGVGLFETMRAYHGRVFRLEAHVDRLITSARELGLTDRLRADPLCEAVERTVAHNKLAEARVRLTVTGGDLALLAAAASDGKAPEHQPGVLIAATAPTAYPPDFFEKGARVVLADPKANPFDPAAGHKTVNYWTRLRVLREAAAAGAGEALWFAVTNHLVGGSVSNAILVKDEQLHTPIARGEEVEGALPAPVLPGITRAAILEAAESLDLPVHRRMLAIDDVLGADEMMLTNSSWGVLPVVGVEKAKVGDGKVGAITRRLRDALFERIADECGNPDADHAS